MCGHLQGHPGREEEWAGQKVLSFFLPALLPTAVPTHPPLYAPGGCCGRDKILWQAIVWKLLLHTVIRLVSLHSC